MTAFTLLLLLCGPAAAQQAPAQDAPAQTAPAAQEAAQPAPPAAGKYQPEILQAMKHLALLLERGGEIAPEKLDALAPQLSAFNGRLKEAIGEKILAEVARREKEAEDKARGEEALALLKAFRGALQVAYTEAGGRYPKTPAALAPRHVAAVPRLRLPGHEASDKVRLVGSRKYDGNPAKAVDDSGGWLYFSDPDSANYGLLMLDCSHEGPEGAKFSDY